MSDSANARLRAEIGARTEEARRQKEEKLKKLQELRNKRAALQKQSTVESASGNSDAPTNAQAVSTSASAGSAQPAAAPEAANVIQPVARPTAKLTEVDLGELINVPPNVRYEVAVQTDASNSEEEIRSSEAGKNNADISSTGQEHNTVDNNQATDSGDNGTGVGIEEDELAMYSEEEAREKWQGLKGDNEFKSWFSGAAGQIERELGSQSIMDCMSDFASSSELSSQGKGELLHIHSRLTCDSTAGRPVSSIKWSTEHRDRLYAGHMDSTSGLRGTSGSVACWTISRTVPELVLKCPAPVTTVSPCPGKGHLVAAGLATGQVALFDIRASPSPQLTFPMHNGHNGMVIHCQWNSAVGNTGTGLTTITSDGYIASWNTQDPSQPLSLHEYFRGASGNNPFSACAGGDSLLVGTESGSIVLPGTKTILKGKHNAPISGISLHPLAQSDVFFQRLLLTSSYDFTCRVWHGFEQGPAFMEFEPQWSYISACSWCPTHSANFACVDADGRLSVASMLRPHAGAIASLQIDSDNTSDSSSAGTVLSCLDWSFYGKLLATGDENGKIHIIQVDAEIGQESPSTQDSVKDMIRSSTDRDQ